MLNILDEMTSDVALYNALMAPEPMTVFRNKPSRALSQRTLDLMTHAAEVTERLAHATTNQNDFVLAGSVGVGHRALADGHSPLRQPHDIDLMNHPANTLSGYDMHQILDDTYQTIAYKGTQWEGIHRVDQTMVEIIDNHMEVGPQHIQELDAIHYAGAPYDFAEYSGNHLKQFDADTLYAMKLQDLGMTGSGKYIIDMASIEQIHLTESEDRIAKAIAHLGEIGLDHLHTPEALYIGIGPLIDTTQPEAVNAGTQQVANKLIRQNPIDHVVNALQSTFTQEIYTDPELATFRAA